jgi:hypothetical protein
VLDARYRQNSSNPVTRAHHSAKNAAQLTRYCCYEITFAGFDGTAAHSLCASTRCLHFIFATQGTWVKIHFAGQKKSF